jgi:hypothetical protein
MSGVELDLVDQARRRELVAWMLVAFLVTFLVTRAVTRAIRTGRGPFRDTSLGGVHVHHQVYGIFLLLGTGTVEFTYRPAGVWADVLAALFGVGAALTLDEFALWLRLDDVYWEREGRSSVDAVLIAIIVGTLLVVGLNPFDDDTQAGGVLLAVSTVANVGWALVAILKGRTVLAVIGIFVPLLATVAALRLARPSSWWARRRYDTRRLDRALRRFPPGHRSRWDRLVDLFALVPAARNDRDRG